MDTGLTLKSATGLAPLSDPRADPSIRNAVATDLAPSRTVTAATDAARTVPADPSRTREIVLDPHSREVIYRVVDVRSGRIVRQVPEEAMLRLRAYTRALLKRRDEDEGNFDTSA